MRTILFAAVAAASVFAFPAFAQVTPTGSGTGVQSSAQAGVSATGAPSNTGMGTTTDAGTSSDATSTSNLGLGGLLKQAEASDPSTSLDGSASLTSSPDAKALVKKARAHGH